jgi:hypothetical protein
MSTAKQISIAAAGAVVTAVGVFGLLVIFPIPILGRAFMAVGFPLGYLLVEVMPDSVLRELAPKGGPDAVGWAFAVSTLLTWFVVLFALWFIVIGRMRSNSTVERDARTGGARPSP